MILKESWQALDRVKTEVYALGTNGQFGVERVVGSQVAAFGTGEVQSTSFLLPEDNEDAVRCMWPIFVHAVKLPDNSREVAGKPKAKMRNTDEPNKRPDQSIVVESRVKVMLFVDTEGTSLVNCHDPFILCEVIAHSMIGAFEHLNERRDSH